MKQSYLLLTILLLVATEAGAQHFSDSVKKIDALFENWNTTTPGAVVSVSRQGKILYEKAFGMADLEHNVINTPETIFEAGSVSKQFTAAAALLLVLEGKINLQDDIRKYFPDFPDYGTPVKVEHLFYHTSGLRDWGSVIGISGWPRTTRVYRPVHVREIIWRQKALNFTPGSQYSYSNSNYNMLVFLVEKVSGQSLQNFTKEKLFDPAGMTHTQWRDDFRNIVPNRSVAYAKAGLFYRQNMPFENTFGHGALLTTVGDLEKWNRRWTLLTLGNQLNELQKTTTTLTDGKPITYACGVVVDHLFGTTEISHSGATAGYRAWLAYYPEKELSVVYLSNDASTNPVAKGRAVAGIFLPSTMDNITEEIHPVQVSTSSWKNFAGLYKSTRSEDVQEFSFEKDSVRIKDNHRALNPVSENSFFEGRFRFTFNTNKLFFQNPAGDTATYIRVEPFHPTEQELQAFAGSFYSEEADAQITFQVQNGRLMALQHGNSSTVLKPSYTDAFFDDDFNLYEFTRDKKKKITGFTISVSRARGVLFIRK